MTATAAIETRHDGAIERQRATNLARPILHCLRWEIHVNNKCGAKCEHTFHLYIESATHLFADRMEPFDILLIHFHCVGLFVIYQIFKMCIHEC